MNDVPSFKERLPSFSHRHPVVLDTLRWVIPALLFGAFLRILLMSYLPYGYWGGDSRSFYVFAHRFLLNGSLSLPEKRRYLYPLLVLPISYLPGGTLRWLPLFQHSLGWITLVPLAYVVRKSLVCWRVWIVPITMVYAGLPIVLWCEHELLADNLFFALFIWTFAGWVAWVTQPVRQRALRMFWAFLVPFALFILTKPSGRFVWPGLCIGLVLVQAWRRLGWPQVVALLAVLVVTPTVGSKKQGAWLLYDATFPLTRLDTPLHADYKAEIREPVERFRRDLDVYHAFQSKEPFYFLRDPGDQDARPLWKALGQDEKLKNKLYLDLALEGIKARPDLFLYLGLQRVVFDANLSEYGLSHFADGDLAERFSPYYSEAEKDETSPLRFAFGLPRKGPLPPYADYRRQLAAPPGSWEARTLRYAMESYGTKLDFFHYGGARGAPRTLAPVRPTFLGCWLALALFLSLLPRYRGTLGVWMIIVVGYAFFVYLVAVVNSHYFAPVWPVLLVLLALPADAILARFIAHPDNSPNSAQPAP
ncbi:MAG: hypothetical protein P4L99_24375 [Chthoniobacter sp.]|nr:hypothetical protein [Chthoniobacter sp.]